MKIALLGNPNTGKSSVFNMLTGLRQHVGNFPGITVDKKFSNLKINGKSHQLIDFPGTISIYPKSFDEQVVYDVLLDSNNPDYPDLVLMVLDASNIRKGLLFCSQVYDLKIPMVLILNMNDVAKKKGISVDASLLEEQMPGIKVVYSIARIGLGKERIFEAIDTHDLSAQFKVVLSDYQPEIKNEIEQEEEALNRQAWVKSLLQKGLVNKEKEANAKPSSLDKVLVHPFWGYVVFLSILLAVFQAVFFLSSFPMDLIDGMGTELSVWIQGNFSEGLLIDLISNGIIPGIIGVVIFIPQIFLLFLLLSLLEESGYLARSVFIMDKLMRPFGLNGKSVVPLVSSVACAIPGVMSARLINNWKERLITIFVAPLMSCSARLPVYALLISLVIPEVYYFGFLSLQAIVLFSMYLLGTFAALIVALVMKVLVKSKGKGFFILELPEYKAPIPKNVFLVVAEKLKIFVFDAGKIIFCISVILWALATFGPNENYLPENLKNYSLKEESLSESSQLEKSYIGGLGKMIEPAIAPLGYDWKIGISILTSFAAREVFVGSLATIYAIDDVEENEKKLFDKLKSEKRKDGSSVFSLATGLSLMIFYAFSMQCMSTLAVVKRETGSWKWPILQVVVFGFMAYLSSFIIYNLFI
ncbi:MAG: ferrous iron transporter B [Crocinitomicaceae bacterium]|nr:ferrous iron transporter B [Crocinitomicaceae bacterium]